MKTFILVLLALIPLSIFAQKIDKKGNIEYNGAVIGRVEKSSGMQKSYSLYDANDEEIVSFEPNGKSAPDFRYIVTFLRTENKGKCPGNLAFNKKIAKAFAKSNLVKGGVYQYKRESRFMAAISGGIYLGGNVDIPPSKQEVTVTGEVEQDLLERNRDAIIQVFGKKVQQDFKNIATIKKSRIAAEGTIIQRIKICNHTGKQIAEAVGRGVTTTKYTVTTLKDNRKHTIEAESSISVVKDIIAMLVEDYYL